MQSFQFQKRNYNIKLGVLEAMETLPQMGVHPLSLVSDMTKTNDTLLTVMLDDEKAVQLMFHYLKKDSEIPWEKFLEQVEMSEIQAFKESFWHELLNFSGPLKKEALIQFKAELKKELANPNLGKSLSGSLQEESESTTLPSES